MKALLIWLRNNTAIPLAMTAATAAIASIHMASEVEPSSYQTLSQSWDTIMPDVRAEIAAELKSGGKISRIEYDRLLQKLTVTYHELRYDGEEKLDLEVERAKVQELANNPSLRPYRTLSELQGMRPVSPGVYTSKEELERMHKELDALKDE